MINCSLYMLRTWWSGLKLIHKLNFHQRINFIHSNWHNMPRGKRTAENDESKVSKVKKKENIVKNDEISFDNDSKTKDGNPWNLKISSWNVNGVRAWIENGGLDYLKQESPDIFCLNETKCPDKKIPESVKNFEGYSSYFLSADTDGYSGVGLMSKIDPIEVKYGIGIKEHDGEGRVITAEYEKFYLVATYVPNSQKKLARLDYRQKWDEDLRNYLVDLDKKKSVILCGDLNVAHKEIDLKNPKTNKKNAGFTQEERDGFTQLLDEGFIDTYRHLYPDVVDRYSFWTYMMNARKKNAGWRLDYFVISKSLESSLSDSIIRSEIFGSDHCPVVLFLSI